jgi:hypothetical protein
VALIATGGFVLHAQSTQASQALTTTVSAQEPIFTLTPADGPQAYSSSDAQQSGTELAFNSTKPLESLNAMQYGGGRQRYGRPRYRGGNTNADGSPKWDFYVGGGFGLPVGDQSNYLTTGWGFHGGGGRMFNKMVGVNLEFSYDHFGMTGATLNDQENLYNNYIILYNQYCASNPSDPGCVANGGGANSIGGLGGNSHIWSFSLQPIVNLKSGEGLGAYVTGGIGFYHKVANFTVPSESEYCDYYYGCYPIESDQVIDHYTSNAPGFDVGFGLTYKFSRFASERLYGEVRYVYMLNSAKPGVDASTCTTLSCAAANGSILNDFPQNSNRTSYIPVKFGLRF